MKANDVFPSKYISQKDLERPMVLTINTVVMEDLDGDHGVESKPIMYFREADSKALVVNKGNWTVCEEAYGEDSDGWVGKRIEIYADPNVMFGSKRVGGVRLRIPTAAPADNLGGKEPFSVTQLKVLIEARYAGKPEIVKVWCDKAGVAKVEDMPEAFAAMLVEKIREKAMKEPSDVAV